MKVVNKITINKMYRILSINIFIISILYFLPVSCVSPPEQTDGLLENIPAIINESDYFSLSILADDYTDSISYDLDLVASDSDILFTTFFLKDIDVDIKDSTYFTILSEQGDTILFLLIQNDATLYGEDSVSVIGVPDMIIFDPEKFSGRLEYQILKK